MKYLASAVAVGLLASTSALAGPIKVTTETPVATNVGGYAMTGFVAPSPDGSIATSASSIASDIVHFTGRNGSALPGDAMIVGDTSDPNDSWWSGASAQFYYAPFSVNWVELVLPSNTFAFSMTIDASVNANAWIIGVDDAGNAVDTSGAVFQLQGDGGFDPAPDFNIQLRNGEAQTFGFYADNSDGSCSTLSRIVVDPNYWAMGDFSINVNDQGCVSVPEPASLPLLALGLVAVFVVGRRRWNENSAGQ